MGILLPAAPSGLVCMLSEIDDDGYGVQSSGLGAYPSYQPRGGADVSVRWYPASREQWGVYFWKEMVITYPVMVVPVCAFRGGKNG